MLRHVYLKTVIFVLSLLISCSLRADVSSAPGAVVTANPNVSNAVGILPLLNGGTGADRIRGLLVIGRLISANMNTTADQAITILANKYVVRYVIATNASANFTISLVAGGVYTAASKGGVMLVSNLQLYTALTSPTKFLELSLLSILTTDVRTEATLFFSLTVAHGQAATSDLYILGERLE